MRLITIISSLLVLTGCGEKVCYTHVSWTQTSQGMKAEVLPADCSHQFNDRNWYYASERGSTGNYYYLSVADDDTYVSFRPKQFPSQPENEWVLGTTLEIETDAANEFYGRFYPCVGCTNEVIGQRACIEPEISYLPNGQKTTMCSATAKLPEDPILHQ